MIRCADISDKKRIGELLYQVHELHAKARPDIFKSGARKFSEEELELRLRDSKNPVFVYEDEDGVCAYVMCIYESTKDKEYMHKRKVLFIDDLCVDASKRGLGIGEKLYRYVVNIARENKCSSVSLHVWNDNKSALKFYERLGMQAKYTEMEEIL